MCSRAWARQGSSAPPNQRSGTSSGFLQPPGRWPGVANGGACRLRVPNPTHGELHLRFAEVPDGPVTLELFDLSSPEPLAVAVIARTGTGPELPPWPPLPLPASGPRHWGRVASRHLQYLPCHEGLVAHLCLLFVHALSAQQIVAEVGRNTCSFDYADSGERLKDLYPKRTSRSPGLSRQSG